MVGISKTWGGLNAWLHAPLDMDHLVAAIASVAIPLLIIIIFVVIAVLSDD
ncbi:hypothetical protein [Kribbella qitaiheensis]|uniref:hypothetical protein n=1 Tax=Kribbella qitaiheensis TaxID=1544730 RepID=UPI0016255AD5|nr:hypothetical protein [Kribbella qitaiheensis]